MALGLGLGLSRPIAASGFQFNDIAGLTHLFDHVVPATATDWVNQASGLDATAVGTPTPDVATANGFAGIRLLASQSFEIADTFNNTGYTAFEVVRLNDAYNAGDSFPRPLRSNVDNQGFFIRASSGVGEYKSTSTSSDPRPTYPFYLEFPEDVVGLSSNTVTLDDIDMYVDGTLVENKTRTSTAASLTVDTGLQIGNSFMGDVFAVVIYDSVLNATQIKQVNDKLYNTYKGDVQRRRMNINASLTSPDLADRQGVTQDGTSFYTSGTDELTRYNSSWSIQDANSTPNADAGLAFTTNHLGDIEYFDGKIYATLSWFLGGSQQGDDQAVAVYDASDLSFISSFDITVVGEDSGSGGIAYNPADGFLYTVSFIEGKIRLYSLAGVFQSELVLDIPIDKMQGIAIKDGFMYISSDVTQGDHGIFKYTTAGVLIGRVKAFTGFQEAEGLAINGTGLISMMIHSGDNNVYFLELEPST